MSSIIKSDALERSSGAVRPFGFSVAAPIADRISNESVLEARIAELDAELAAQAEGHDQELDLAREEATREALEQRSDAEKQALEALAEALKDARASWRKRLTSWESAACGIARAALEQMVGEVNDHGSLVEAAIARQLTRVEAESIIRIRVNAEDFADEDSIRRLKAALGVGFEIGADATLPRGGCIFDLKLGHMDATLGAQWARLTSLLDRLEREGLDP